MKVNLYQHSGYLDWESIYNLPYPFIFICGGRGTGKTYGALEYVYTHDIKFFYLRRMQAQVDIVKTPEFNPFKSLNNDHGWNVGLAPVTKYSSGFYDMVNIDGKDRPEGPPKGIISSLSTFSNLRGFDASDVEVMIFDEFIPERHERPIKDEGNALLNAYETVNRNRELQGREPLKLICLSNSNTMANEIFINLNLVRVATRMKETGQEIAYDNKRGICLIVMDESPISEQKRDTVLYRLTDGLEFSKMALDNDFVSDEIGIVRSRNLKELRTVVTVGEITFYRHKSNGTLYVSTHRSGECPIYGSGPIDLKRFQKSYMWIWRAYMSNKIEFEEYLCEILLTKYFE